MNEIWKDIPGYEGHFQASSIGRIRSVDRFYGGGWHTGRIRALHFNNDGYYQINLGPRNDKKSHSVHKLVMNAFFGLCPKGMERNHKNGNKADNRIENLEYCTRSQNVLHAFRVLGRAAPRGACKLTDKQVIRIIKLYASGKYGYSDLSVKFKVTKANIASIIKFRTWKHIPR